MSSHIQRIGCQSHSWSAEKGKREQKKKFGSAPPPPRCSSGKKKEKKITSRICRRYGGLGPSRARARIPSTQSSTKKAKGCRFANSYASVCDNNFPSIVASLFFWRCLAASTSYFLNAAMNLRPASETVSTHTSAVNAVAFHYFSFPHPVLFALHPQDFRTRFAFLAAARRSFG